MIDTLIIPRHVAFLPCAGFGMLRVHAGGNSAPMLVFRGESLQADLLACARMADLLLLLLIKGLSRVPFLFAAFCRVRELPAVRPVLNAVDSYRRPFPTFAAAAAAIAGNEGGGRSNAYIGQTVRDAKRAACPTIRRCFIFRPSAANQNRV